MVCHCVDCRTRLAVGRAYWTLVIEQTIADLAGRDSTATEPIQHEYLHARCDYCGTIFPLDGSRHGVTLDWVETEMLDDGRVIATTGIYCSKPCGEYASSRAGTVRG
jgi:hypothetical protein